MHKKQLLFARKGDVGFNWGSACASKGDGGFNPTHRRASKGDAGFTREICDARGLWRGLAGQRADAPSHTSATRRRRCGGRRRVRRVQEGLAAVPVGGGGAWPGFEATRRSAIRPHRCEGRRRDLPRCRWAVAGPGRASSRRAKPHVSAPGAAGVEGAGGTGGHGRASRSTTPSRRLACGDLAGGRARRRPEHQRRHKHHRTKKPQNSS